MAIRAMDPEADRTVLKKIIGRFATTANSVRDIAKNLLRPAELIALGTSIMDEVERSPMHTWKSARDYCDGLIIHFMTLCPLRPGAVADMMIGEHLVLDEDGIRVCFPPLEHCKRRIEDVPLTDDLVPRFRHYLNEYRPLLAVHGTQHSSVVWLTAYGNPLDVRSLTKRVRHNIKIRTRKNFSAHMFRHAAATFITDFAPEHARMIVGLLGHSGFRTGRDHYIKGRQHSSMRTYHACVADVVRRARRRKQ